MYHNFFIHSSVNGHLGCFHVLAIANGAVMNTGIYVSFVIMVLSKNYPGRGLLGHMVIIFLVFLRNLHTVLHSGSINLHSHQQCKTVAFYPHALQHLLLVYFLMMVILTCVGWYIMVVLLCISLIISNVEHFVICLLSICLSFWRISI